MERGILRKRKKSTRGKMPKSGDVATFPVRRTQESLADNTGIHRAGRDQFVTARFGPTTGRTESAGTKRGRPIAQKLIRQMKKKAHGKVIDLEEVMAGRAYAEELQKTVANRDELAGLHPAHAAYACALDQVSVMSEQLTALNEMARFVKIISAAEDEYMPSGPPMSPLTNSFFTCWAFFDVCVGLAEETICTTAMAVGAAFGMHNELNFPRRHWRQRAANDLPSRSTAVRCLIYTHIGY